MNPKLFWVPINQKSYIEQGWLGLGSALSYFMLSQFQPRPLGLSCFCKLSLDAWFQLTMLSLFQVNMKFHFRFFLALPDNLTNFPYIQKLLPKILKYSMSLPKISKYRMFETYFQVHNLWLWTKKYYFMTAIVGHEPRFLSSWPWFTVTN